MKVIEGVYDGVSTTELDNLAAEVSASFTTKQPGLRFAGFHESQCPTSTKTQRSLSLPDHGRPLQFCRSKDQVKNAPLVADDVHKSHFRRIAETLDSHNHL